MHYDHYYRMSTEKPFRSPSPVLVVAAIIERDGQVLLGQRKPGDWNEFKWEFPGGKVDPGETPRQALARELIEELGIVAEIGAELTRYGHEYRGRSAIELIFYRVRVFTGEPANHAFHQIRWEQASGFDQYDFLDGDLDFVRRYVRGEFD
jgi:8-oxo-dGTP diphosphatase